MFAYRVIVHLSVFNCAAASSQIASLEGCYDGSGTCLTDAVSLLQTFVQPTRRTSTLTMLDSVLTDSAGCDLGELEWAVSIDGRDAHMGRNAYTNFEQVFLTMHNVLTNSSAYSLAELSLGIVEQIQNECCAKYRYREPWFGPPMSGFYDTNGGVWPTRPDLNGNATVWHWNATEKFHGPLGICMSYCRDVEVKRSLVADLPDDLLHVIYQQQGSEADRHIDQILLRNDIDARAMLHVLISNYNDDLKVASGSHHLKMEALARFLRRNAWLHPFLDDNGRTRNLILQREVRRLGLGRCAMMYNNNRDIYFTSTSAYADKIREGIAAADETRATGQHAWLNATRVAKHLERFNTSAFAYCRQWEEHQWGSIN